MTSPITEPTTPPTEPKGYEASGLANWGHFTSGMPLDQYEDVPELMWPNGIKVFHKMRTDAQIDSLIKAVRLPLGRLRWKIKPNGARDEVVSDVSQQMGLPIQGDNDEFIVSGRQRFNHLEHLRMALLAPLVYGHMPFEQVGEIIVPNANTLRWRMTGLSPRMPQTITGFDVSRNGDLNAIIQYDATMGGTVGYRDINSGGQRGRGGINSQPRNQFIQGIPIPATQLAMYVWEREGGNWAGRSMMRPLFKYWILKDRMLRIDAMKNERYGLGIPTGTAPPGGDPADYSKLAQSVRAVENGGVGLPNGATMGIQGITGSLPDTLASIRMYDEQMARSFLAMFIQLGQTETGSRALGESFVDFFEDALWEFVNWYATITTHDVIWDIVDWNYGEDEQAPTITAEEDPDRPLGAEELARLVQSGSLLVDEELQNWIRKRFSMPDYKGADPLPTKPGDMSQESVPSGNTPDNATVSARGRRERINVRAHADHDQASHGNRPNKDTKPEDDEIEVDPNDVPPPKVNDDGTVSFPITSQEKSPAKVTFASSQTARTTRIGHREPTAVEAQAGTDFSKIQKAWEDALKALIEKWNSDIRPSQIDAVVKTVEDAVKASDPKLLAFPSIDTIGQDVIFDAMNQAAATSVADALAEAASQNVTLPGIDVEDLASSLTFRATQVANLLSNGLSLSAGRTAVTNYSDGVDPSDVGSAVRDSLEGLSDSYLEDQLGGALTGAQNMARLATFTSGDETPMMYASELLDENTCVECEKIDGHEYGDANQAVADYPAGGYADCLGGPRCRGTLVAVYGEGQDE